jgi:hypothetical protein
LSINPLKKKEMRKEIEMNKTKEEIPKVGGIGREEENKKTKRSWIRFIQTYFRRRYRKYTA